ncbi:MULTISPECIES: small multidrug efflux protein [unclassified Microbacterium]|uniref:small multidrug efflux protein n=1 Tax=unclassified Microbacterium TaxID=2609290 RepID=UPI000EA9E5DF|nr:MULTISPECIES: small multidrug efflux protein [unclassified Microbacterium]MBT2484007.1 small multidrug efflux protein [Microbacterium sp. ISL-108]RKN66966.1 small multidrug efflux protein [Microbacterium sp. CGR2]
MDNPYPWLQDFINQVPEILQPLMVAAVAAIPYIEGEGAAAFGILAGINPIVAALAAMAGNILCVIGVVLLGSRIRGGVVARRAARRESSSIATVRDESRLVSLSTATAMTERGTGTVVASGDDSDARPSKGREKLGRWLVKFGVPGASLFAPIALPTMLTAAFFVASGVRKEWVILWQIVAIVLWTGAVAVVATGVLSLLGW